MRRPAPPTTCDCACARHGEQVLGGSDVRTRHEERLQAGVVRAVPAAHGTGTAPLAVITAAPSGLRTKARKRATRGDGSARVSSSEGRISG